MQSFVQARPALRGDGIVVAGIRPGTDAYFVGELSSEDGSLGWSVPIDGPFIPQGLGLQRDGSIYLSGYADGPFRITVGGASPAPAASNFGGGSRPVTDQSGWIAQYTAANVHVWDTIFGTVGESRARLGPCPRAPLVRQSSARSDARPSTSIDARPVRLDASVDP